MTQSTLKNDRIYYVLYVVALLLSSIASIFSISYGQRLFIYPVVTVFLAIVVAGLFLPGIDRYTQRFTTPKILAQGSRVGDDRVFSILLFSTIGLLQIVYTLSGFNDFYYLLLMVFTGVFVILVLRRKWKQPLLALLLFAVIFRAHIWFSAPIYSKDPRLHTAIVGYMIQQNELIPDGISYYWGYPIADIFAKEVALLLSATPKRAYFYAITVPAVIAGFVAFPAVRRVLNYRHDSIAVASIVIVLFSAFHLVESSGPKPQTLSTFYLAVILLLFTAKNRHQGVLAAVFFFMVVKTHLLAPLIAIGLVGSYFLVVTVYPMLVSSSEYEIERGNPYIMAIALTIATLQQYHFVGHFRLQVSRLLSTFQPDRGGASAFISQAGELTTTDVPLTLDPLLLQAGTLLVIGFLVVIAGFLFLSNLLCLRSDQIEWEWILTGAVLFALFGLAFFGSAVIRRGAAALSVLTAPLVAFVLVKLARERGVGTTVVFIILLLSGTYLGLAHPGVLLSERDNGFKPTLDHAEVESIEFVRGIEQEPYSFSYYSASAQLQTVKDGQIKRFIRGYGHHSRVEPGTMNRFCKEHPDQSFVYRPYYETYAGISFPHEANVVYSTSGVRILSNCGGPANR